MSLRGWVLGVGAVVSVAAAVAVPWPQASAPPVLAEVTAPASPMVTANRTPSPSEEKQEEKQEEEQQEPSAQRARTLAAEDALVERSEVARAALIKRQRTRLERAVASAEIAGNPERARVLRERLSDLERLVLGPVE